MGTGARARMEWGGAGAHTPMWRCLWWHGLNPTRLACSMGIISFSLTISYELGIHYEHDIFICFEFAVSRVRLPLW